eukprot:g11067.t1
MSAAKGPAPPGQPLFGQTFVFTAAMENLERSVAEVRVKTLGGKVTGSISGKTTYLVAGSILEHAGAPGPGGAPAPDSVEQTSKYRKAQQLIDEGKGIKILREEEFAELLRVGDEARAAAGFGGVAAAAPGGVVLGASNPAGPTVVAGAPSASASFSRPGSAAAVPLAPAAAVGEQLPWVIKYAPKSVEELQGHQTQVKKLSTWLQDWDNVVLRGEKKPAGNFRGQPENVNARGALITGPPGIGKTTAVKLICEQFKDTHVAQWYNASDSRSKKVIDQLSMGIAQVAGVDWANGGKLIGQKMTKRTIIVMDEADGALFQRMGAGDRMGTAALAQLISKTQNPVICIANDSSKETKMRTLGTKCFDVKFSRPVKTQIAKRLAFICAQEGIHAEVNALEALAEACGNDLRQCITQCQSLACRGAKTIDAGSLTFENVKDKVREIEKDLSIDGFGAARKLLMSSENRKLNLHEKMDAFFADYDFVPLLVQENYVKYYENSNQKSMIDVAFAADLIAAGDYTSKVLRKENAWSLLNDVGLLSSVYPTQKVNGFRNFPDFPQWLGKNSSANKSKRVVKDLHEVLWKRASLTPDQMVCSGYSELLYTKIIKALKAGNITEAAKLLDAHGLSRDHLMAQLSECRAPFDLRDEYKLLDSSVKKELGTELKKTSYCFYFR